MEVLSALVPHLPERSVSTSLYKTGVWRVSSPTSRGIQYIPRGLQCSSAPTHSGHEPDVISGKCSQLQPILGISKFQFRSSFLLLLHPGSFSALLLFADLHCPITVSSCKLSTFAIRRVCRFAADNDQLFCTHHPNLPACLFIKLIHNHFLHQPAWISFPLNISLSIEFLLQRGEGSFYIPKWSDCSTSSQHSANLNMRRTKRNKFQRNPSVSSHMQASYIGEISA